jgi:hypothetical protein
MEAGTVFDTNVYDKGDALPTSGVTRPKAVVDAEQRAQVGNNEIQDIAALVKVRRYMKNDVKDNPAFSSEWDKYCKQALQAVENEARKQALEANMEAAQEQYAASEVAMKKKFDELRKEGAVNEEDLKHRPPISSMRRRSRRFRTREKSEPLLSRGSIRACGKCARIRRPAGGSPIFVRRTSTPASGGFARCRITFPILPRAWPRCAPSSRGCATCPAPSMDCPT